MTTSGLSREEAKTIADQWVHDVMNASDVDEACNMYAMFMTSDLDMLMIGRFLIEPVTEALKAFSAGDRSRGVANIAIAALRHEQGKKPP